MMPIRCAHFDFKKKEILDLKFFSRTGKAITKLHFIPTTIVNTMVLVML